MRVALQNAGTDALRNRLGDRFLFVLALALLGYALGGRGFAYAGVQPIFVGEAVLIFGLVAFAMTTGWPSVMRLPQIFALWMADPKFKVKWIWATLLTVNMVLMGVIDRAGLVTFGAVMILCLIAKPRHEAAWRTISMLLCGVVLLWASSFRMEIPGGKGREISIEQFVESFRSIFGRSTSEGMESNKEWRLQWWGEIIHYTFNGEYF